MTEKTGGALDEADLLRQILQPLPADVRRRWDELIVKRDTETLTSEEHAELIALTNVVENHNVQRMELIALLAEHRGTKFIDLWNELRPRLKPRGGQ